MGCPDTLKAAAQTKLRINPNLCKLAFSIYALHCEGFGHAGVRTLRNAVAFILVLLLRLRNLCTGHPQGRIRRKNVQ